MAHKWLGQQQQANSFGNFNVPISNTISQNYDGANGISVNRINQNSVAMESRSLYHSSSQHSVEGLKNGLDENESLRNSMCFVCSTNIEGKNFIGIRNVMNHSRAPALALLTDVLGYKLDDAKLHSEVVCKSCFQLLDIIDELQQTLTASKTDVRTKFLDSIHQHKLKYPRTDKMLKPRCQRCIQNNRGNAKKKQKSSNKMLKKSLYDESERLKTKTRIEEAKAKRVEKVSKPQKNKFLLPSSSVSEADSLVDVESEVSTSSPIPVEQVSKSAEVVYDTDPAMFSSNERLKVGLKNVSDSSATNYSCFYCQRTFDAGLSLKMHVRVHHMPVLVYDNGHGTPESRYRMGIKLQNFDKPAAEKPFSCLFCESAYKLQSSLQSHFREHHSPHKPFECQECKDTFRRPIELSRHRLYRCPAKGTANR